MGGGSMDVTQWILVGLGVLTFASTVLSGLTRQQMQITKLEIDTRLAAMELRLAEKIGASFVTWQAHDELGKRVDRIDRYQRGD
jgi:hypothetical protein